jgi:hypothetical protein
MTPRDRRSRGPQRDRAAAASRRDRGPHHARAWTWVLAGIAIAGVVAVAWMRLGPGSGAHAPETGADSVAAMPPEMAFERAAKLTQEKRYVESVPYFRRVAEVSDGWIQHWNYATALNNAAFEVASRHGVTAPASRSAIERLELTRAALDEIAIAERRAPNRRTIVMMEVARGRRLELWGFPLDALEIYRAAATLDPSATTVQKVEAACLARLRGAGGATPEAEGD